MKRCAVCMVPSDQMLCQGCWALLEPIEFPCQCCAKPLNQEGICGECQADQPAYTSTYSVTVYQPPASQWVQQLKFGDRLDRARIMAETMADKLSAVPVHVPIVPVPLHPKRLRSRGYNQALEVARMICKIQQRPLLSDLLVRVKYTAMQAELHEKQRAANVRSAFSVVKPIKHEVVILLDDVMTTGQTLRSAAKTLKKAGQKEILVAVFARSNG